MHPHELQFNALHSNAIISLAIFVQHNTLTLPLVVQIALSRFLPLLALSKPYQIELFFLTIDNSAFSTETSQLHHGQGGEEEETIQKAIK
jgi:hypothetical protein